MTKEQFTELITKLNDSKTRQTFWFGEYGLDFEGNEDFNNIFKNSDFEDVATVNPDKHRHYELGTVVYKIENFYLGIEMVVDTFSESTEISDCYHCYRFMEMKPAWTMTYVEA